MTVPMTQEDKVQRGSSDAGRYFRYMIEFVGFTPEDGKAIHDSALVIEKHLPTIVSEFYANLLRYPPTRQPFLKPDGTIDQDYIQKRMHHLTNFWRRTASGSYDEEYARYIDYVGLAHTNRGADPNIYIAERYVIGQVGFMQHAITRALIEELHEYDPDLESRSVAAWNKLMMVILEMLARAYGTEHEGEHGDATRLVVDREAMQQLAVETYELGLGLMRPQPLKEIHAGSVLEIPEGERKLVDVDGISIGVFHHKGEWIAVQNHCLHRGGPVATGALEGDVLVCPWHGYRYDLPTGKLLVDPTVRLTTYPVSVRDDEVYISVPEAQYQSEVMLDGKAAVVEEPEGIQLEANEFRVASIPPGKTGLVKVGDQPVAVYNVDGKFYATSNLCTHVGGPLNEGKLEDHVIECPWHGSKFNVTTGRVMAGPAMVAVRTYRVRVEGEVGRVTSTSTGALADGD